MDNDRDPGKSRRHINKRRRSQDYQSASYNYGTRQNSSEPFSTNHSFSHMSYANANNANQFAQVNPRMTRGYHNERHQSNASRGVPTYVSNIPNSSLYSQSSVPNNPANPATSFGWNNRIVPGQIKNYFQIPKYNPHLAPYQICEPSVTTRRDVIPSERRPRRRSPSLMEGAQIVFDQIHESSQSPVDFRQSQRDVPDPSLLGDVYLRNPLYKRSRTALVPKHAPRPSKESSSDDEVVLVESRKPPNVETPRVPKMAETRKAPIVIELDSSDDTMDAQPEQEILSESPSNILTEEISTTPIECQNDEHNHESIQTGQDDNVNLESPVAIDKSTLLESTPEISNEEIPLIPSDCQQEDYKYIPPSQDDINFESPIAIDQCTLSDSVPKTPTEEITLIECTLSDSVPKTPTEEITLIECTLSDSVPKTTTEEIPLIECTLSDSVPKTPTEEIPLIPSDCQHEDYKYIPTSTGQDDTNAENVASNIDELPKISIATSIFYSDEEASDSDSTILAKSRHTREPSSTEASLTLDIKPNVSLFDHEPYNDNHECDDDSEIPRSPISESCRFDESPASPEDNAIMSLPPRVVIDAPLSPHSPPLPFHTQDDQDERW